MADVVYRALRAVLTDPSVQIQLRMAVGGNALTVTMMHHQEGERSTICRGGKLSLTELEQSVDPDGAVLANAIVAAGRMLAGQRFSEKAQKKRRKARLIATPPKGPQEDRRGWK